MPMNAQELQQLYALTKKHYDNFENNNTASALAQRVKSSCKAQHDQNNIDHVVNMYLDIKQGLSPQVHAVHAQPLSSGEPSSSTTSSWFNSFPRHFTYVDNSWNWSTTNTTHINNSTSRNKNNKKEEKDASLEERLMQIGLLIVLGLISGIAAITCVPLCYEIFNHASRIYHHEGTAQGALLLMGIATSYCLAMLSIYGALGGLFMGLMTAAGFANPAAWACAVIALSAVIAIPLFNMFIREGIDTLFSAFDNQALVSSDNRFRALTPAEVDRLDDTIDPDRVNFAILCKYDELKPTQKRQRFAFFDYDTPEMSRVLTTIRQLRSTTSDKAHIDIKIPGSESVSFSLFKPSRTEKTHKTHDNITPSAPPMAHAEVMAYPI